MNSLAPALQSNLPLSVNLVGKNQLLREFGTDKDFLNEIKQLLLKGAFGGSFTVAIDSKIKGRSHTQGFQLGSPNHSRRSVEVRWQSGGNDTRFSLQLNAPHGMEPNEFHSRLDQAIKEKVNGDQHVGEEINGTSLDIEEASTAPEDVIVVQTDSLSEVDIELFLQEILPTATAAGVVARQTCLDVLSQLGRRDLDVDMQYLFDGRYLEVGKTKAFVCLTGSSLTRLRNKHQPKEPSLEISSSEKNGPLTTSIAMVNLLSEAEKLTKIVEEAKQYRLQLPQLQAEVSELEKLIATSNERLAVIKPQLATAETFLANEEVITQAEHMLCALRQLLGK